MCSKLILYYMNLHRYNDVSIITNFDSPIYIDLFECIDKLLAEKSLCYLQGIKLSRLS